MSKQLKYTRSPRSFKRLWQMYSFISMNAWIWSTIFHTKDLQFTEIMDYFSAFALVLFQFVSFFIRFSYNLTKYLSHINTI